jgi:hypothetical protein
VAARDNTSDELIDAVRRDSFMAQSGSSDNWTDERILGIADDCLLDPIAPTLKRAKVGWFREDFGLEIESEVARYDVPEEAMWNGLESLFLVDPTAEIISGELKYVDPSNRMMYGSLSPAIPTRYWFDNTQIVLSPPPSSDAVSSYSVTASMYRRPGQLVLLSSVRNVTAVNSVTQTVTIASIPSTWTTDTYTSGTPYRIDIYNRLLPNTRLLWNKTCSASATVLTFSPSITTAEFASISVGDVVTMKGTTPYPDIPPDGVPYLRKMIVRTILTAQTDAQALQVYLGQQAEALANFLRGMSNRADGSPRKLSLRNAGTSRFMRNYGSRFRRS